jgi:biopolymer transport protein ExbD
MDLVPDATQGVPQMPAAGRRKSRTSIRFSMSDFESPTVYLRNERRVRQISIPPVPMNALETASSGTKKARVEIIPLIDVIFFLLATFVLFTLSLNRVKVLEAELPAGSDKVGVDETTAFIQASADGTFHWKVGRQGPSETITTAELPHKLALYKNSVKLPRVLLRSDRAAKLKAAVIVLDEVHRAKIKDVAIETMSSETGS